jgi:hypothetical protein
MGYKLAAQLPDARLVVLPRSTHLLPSERPTQCSALIRGFTSGRVPHAGVPAETGIVAPAPVVPARHRAILAPIPEARP